MTTIDALESLAEGFSGVILAPGDAGYDAARKIHNGLIDKRPALIACCRNTADIVDAVNAAREADLEISVRGGGHNVAGKAVTEGGLMIDLTSMKGIHVDPARRTVRPGPAPGSPWPCPGCTGLRPAFPCARHVP